MSQAGTGIDLNAFVNFINKFREGTQHPGTTTHRHVHPAGCPTLSYKSSPSKDEPEVPSSDPRLVQLLPHQSGSASLRPGDLSYALRALQADAQTRNKGRI